MKTLLRLLALSLALAGCSPQQQPPQASVTCAPSVSHVVLEPDADDLLRNHLTDASRNIREALRQQRTPSTRREIVGDHLEVEVGAGADMSAALSRIRTLGGDDWVVTQQGETLVQVQLSPEVFAALQVDSLAASLEAAQRRIEAADLEATAAELPPSRLCVEAPGFDAEQLDRLADLLTKPGVLTLNLVDEEATAQVRLDTDPWPAGEERRGRIALPDDSLDGRLQVIETDAILTGSDIADASQVLDESDQPSIGFELHPAGAQRFGRVTSQNVSRPFAIVLDDRIVSAPVIQSPITGGSGRITGRFTKEQAEDLAIVLRSGALPAKLTVVEKVVAK